MPDLGRAGVGDHELGDAQPGGDDVAVPAGTGRRDARTLAVRVRVLAARRGLGYTLVAAVIGTLAGAVVATIDHNLNSTLLQHRLPEPGYAVCGVVGLTLALALGVVATSLAVARARPRTERTGLGNAASAAVRGTGPAFGSGARAWTAPAAVGDSGGPAGPGGLSHA